MIIPIFCVTIFVIMFLFFFFFNDTATTEIYTLSLHDALPICCRRRCRPPAGAWPRTPSSGRSEEHTSELQSRFDLVCRLLLEKKKNPRYTSSEEDDPCYGPLRYRFSCRS